MVNPLASWNQEQRSAFLYRVCADAESSTPRAELFHRLSAEAEARAVIWRAQLTAQGHPPPGSYEPDLRTRLVASLVRQFGPRRFEDVLAAMNVHRVGSYRPTLPLDPAGATTVAPTGVYRHRGLRGGGMLRATIFGVNDGLLSNTCLILGVVGVYPDARVAVVAGLSGMFAGALAMASGEYMSMSTDRKRFESPRNVVREETAQQYPEARAKELALTYSAKGPPKGDASRLATRIAADPGGAKDTLGRAELGFSSDDNSTRWSAAVNSFLSFAAGALIPLAPFMLAPAARALPLSMGAAALGLVCVGASLSLFTGRSAWRSGARMLALGGLAGGTTFAIGHLAGVALG